MTDQQRALKIINAVCGALGTDYQTICQKTRKREVLEPRQWCMYFLRKYTRLSLPGIAEYFDQDHATVMNSIKVIENLIDYNGYAVKRRQLNAKVLWGIGELKNELRAKRRRNHYRAMFKRSRKLQLVAI